MPLGNPSDPPKWDQEEADGLIGQYVLVGMTYLKPDGKTVKSRGEYHGRIVSADREAGIKVRCEGKWEGHVMGLPPILDIFRPAKPGNYELYSTGEVVSDVDYLTTWSVIEPLKS
jgi:hypothetical protein